MKNTACKKCNGLGYIPMFAGIEGGRCFACNDPRTASDLAHLAQIDAELRATSRMTSEERNAYFAAQAAVHRAAAKTLRSAQRARRADAAL